MVVASRLLALLPLVSAYRLDQNCVHPTSYLRGGYIASDADTFDDAGLGAATAIVVRTGAADIAADLARVLAGLVLVAAVLARLAFCLSQVAMIKALCAAGAVVLARTLLELSRFTALAATSTLWSWEELSPSESARRTKGASSVSSLDWEGASSSPPPASPLSSAREVEPGSGSDRLPSALL